MPQTSKNMRLSTCLLLFFSFTLCVLLFACQTDTSNTNQNVQVTATATNTLNPAAKGFNKTESDAKAIEIADSVMTAMGGWKNWNNTRYLKWNFFGRRTLLWDKKNGDVRIHIPEDSLQLLVNVDTKEGKVLEKGIEVSDAEALKEQLQKAYEIWVNDSYWLVMPFKLKDSGVTLKYVGEGQSTDGKEVEVIQLTFNEVGVTPENKYLVSVDKATNLVSEWSFFAQVADDTARFTTPWKDYQPYGKILLGGDRGKGQLTDIEVFEELPDGVFEGFEVEMP